MKTYLLILLIGAILTSIRYTAVENNTDATLN
jgi:hypothetical protein